jgi:predicted ATPase
MVNAVDYLVAQGVVIQTNGHWELKGELKEIEVGVPENLRQIVEKQIERLSPEDQRMLEVASVVGVEFSVAIVVAALESDAV